MKIINIFIIAFLTLIQYLSTIINFFWENYWLLKMVTKKKNSELKVLLLGDSFVGKTTLLLKYFQGEFIVNLDDTWRGVNLFRKTITDNPNQTHVINVWDIAGNKNYMDFFNLITHPMHAVIFVASSDDRDLENSIKGWNDLFNHIVNPNFTKFLIINKKTNDSIDTSNFMKILQENNILKVFVADAKKPNQVNEVFEEIFEDVLATLNN